MSLDSWKKLSVFETTLQPSGVTIKARYLDMEQAVGSGEFDIAVLEELEKVTGSKNGHKPTQQQVAEGLRYKQWVVCANVQAVDGEDVTLTAEDYQMLPEADRDVLFRYINRTKPVPLAGG